MYRDKRLNDNLVAWFNLRKSTITMNDIQRPMFWRGWLSRNGYDYDPVEFRDYFMKAYKLTQIINAKAKSI